MSHSRRAVYIREACSCAAPPSVSFPVIPTVLSDFLSEICRAHPVRLPVHFSLFVLYSPCAEGKLTGLSYHLLISPYIKFTYSCHPQLPLDSTFSASPFRFLLFRRIPLDPIFRSGHSFHVSGLDAWTKLGPSNRDPALGLRRISSSCIS